MWRAGREAIALAARCAHLARERGVSSSSSSHARWSFGKKSGKHRRGPPTTGAMGGGSLTASQFEEEAHRLASGDGVVFFKDKITQITQGAVDVSLPGRDDAYYNAPGDYAGVAIRSSLRWPMPMDDLAKLNPKLALAMGQSRQQVANANRGREALNPVGNPNTRAAHGALSADDAPTATDPRVMDGDELAIVKMLEEDRLEAMRKEAFALVEGRERRRRETERENAPKPERRERTVGAREMAAQLATERARVDRKLAKRWSAGKRSFDWRRSGSRTRRRGKRTRSSQSRGPPRAPPPPCTSTSSGTCSTGATRNSRRRRPTRL